VIAVAVLGAAAAGLAWASVASARRPDGAVPGLDGYLSGWSALHGGYDAGASPWTRGWLAAAYRPAAVLARRGVAPDVLTAWTLWLSGTVVVAAAAGGRWWTVAGLLVVVGAFVDSLDGAVAVLTGRATRWGYVLDSVVDRVADVAAVAAVWLAGGQAVAAVAAGAALVLLEYTRARAGSAGMGEVAVVTVGERPTRVIVCALALAAAGAVPAFAPWIATAGLVVLAVLSAAGLVQLLVVVHRRLSR
jgi:phosphatidylglycerophosphate synthase